MIGIIIAALATFGISALVSSYDGPRDVLLNLRHKLHIPDCTVCLSVWMAIPIAYFTSVGIIGYLAIIGLVIIGDRLT